MGEALILVRFKRSLSPPRVRGCVLGWGAEVARLRLAGSWANSCGGGASLLLFSCKRGGGGRFLLCPWDGG